MMEIGWLSKDGDFYKCKYQEHLDLACELCDKYYPGTYCGFERKLEESGWVKIGLSLFGNKEYFFHFECYLSDEQKNFLREWLDEHDSKQNEIPISELNRGILMDYINGVL